MRDDLPHILTAFDLAEAGQKSIGRPAAGFLAGEQGIHGFPGPQPVSQAQLTTDPATNVLPGFRRAQGQRELRPFEHEPPLIGGLRAL